MHLPQLFLEIFQQVLVVLSADEPEMGSKTRRGGRGL